MGGLRSAAKHIRTIKYINTIFALLDSLKDEDMDPSSAESSAELFNKDGRGAAGEGQFNSSSSEEFPSAERDLLLMTINL